MSTTKNKERDKTKWRFKGGEEGGSVSKKIEGSV